MVEVSFGIVWKRLLCKVCLVENFPSDCSDFSSKLFVRECFYFLVEIFVGLIFGKKYCLNNIWGEISLFFFVEIRLNYVWQACFLKYFLVELFFGICLEETFMQSSFG